MIVFDRVSKQYADGVFAVREVNLSVAEGEIMVLLGASGSGKTTTLKMINRLIEPTSGTITVNGSNVIAIDPITLRRSIGYVVQGVGLFPHLTIAQNIAIVPELLGWEPHKIQARVEELLELVHLPAPEFRNRLPSQLSGGQQQRVGFARALAAGPRLLLMDEPFGALDPLTRDALQDEFKRLQTTMPLTVVLVTHDMTEALLLADRIAVMNEGRLLQEGTPQELLTQPADPYVEQLLATPRRQAKRLQELALSNPTRQASSVPLGEFPRKVSEPDADGLRNLRGQK